MATTDVLRNSLTEQFREVFEGNPWYGESLTTKLNQIREEADQPQKLNKTASFIQHLINWRQFVIRKLEGDEAFDIILNTNADWTDVKIDEFEEWDALVLRLFDSQKQLLKLLDDKTDHFLIKQVPGKTYSYEHMLHGLLQHDVYHTGQIAVYWKRQ